jgi:hypothetical protein
MGQRFALPHALNDKLYFIYASQRLSAYVGGCRRWSAAEILLYFTHAPLYYAA